MNHFWPAFVAALFYGFSPYMAGEGMAHLNLIFIPFPPLILCSVYEIFTSHEHRYRWGIALGIFIIFQYMMSSELLATTALITLIALFILAIANPGKIKSALSNAVGPLTLGIFIALLALFYPIWYSLDGPQHLIAPIHIFNNQFHADLLGTIFPTIAQKLYPSNWLTRGTSFLQGNWDENGSYLGIPLLVLLIGIGIRLRKNRWVRFFLIMAIVAWVISLGPYLTIDNHTTSIPLPFDLMSSIPLLNNILSSRIAMYSDLFIALVLALGVEQIYISHIGNRKENESALNKLANLPLERGIDPQVAGKAKNFKLSTKGLLTTMLGLVTVLSLIPAWPDQSPASLPNATSSFFTSKQLDLIPNKAVTLTYPYPIYSYNEAMVWQILSQMRFRLLGGYNLFTIPPGIGSGLPAELFPPQVESALSYFADGITWPLTTPPTDQALSRKILQQFISNNHVQVIIVNTYAQNSEMVLRAFRRAFGSNTYKNSGLAIWILHR